MRLTISEFISDYSIYHIDFSSSAIAAQESLSGLETEMRKLEGIVKEIVDEMDYLKKREERFSSTNGTCSCHIPFWTLLILYDCTTLESTNQRVQSFGFYTFIALVGLGVWQIFHLRSYFKRKYLID